MGMPMPWEYLPYILETREDGGINVFTYPADLATLISDARMNAIDKYSPHIPPPTVYG